MDHKIGYHQVIFPAIFDKHLCLCEQPVQPGRSSPLIIYIRSYESDRTNQERNIEMLSKYPYSIGSSFRRTTSCMECYLLLSSN